MDLEPSVNSDPRRNLPSVDRLVRQARAREPDLPPWALAAAARQQIEVHRRALAFLASEPNVQSSDPPGIPPQAGPILETVVSVARALARRHPRGVLNATGVLLHTNLGRAPLPAAARQAVAEAARGYSDLELDLASGQRGARLGALEAKLIAASGAEAAHVVNNCAAAVLLALNTLALDRSVLVSRGELVEIGGSFRVPAIMERAGVRLVEVGTTNRTHLADYEAAIDSGTALILKVHRSNFEQQGFVAETGLRELAGLARSRGLPLMEDLGSGTLLDLRGEGLPEDSFVPARLALGADLVCFSGDKLLGGPQAGILLGRREWIEAMRRNPLTRALRIDKLTLAALDATLDLVLDAPSRGGAIPVVAGLRAGVEVLEPRARRILEALEPLLPEGWKARIEPSESAVGGGSLPGHRLTGRAVVLSGGSPGDLAERLRAAPTPLLARIQDETLWLDVRTLGDEELPAVIEALAFAFSFGSPGASGGVSG